ncbi:uncharacterized protein LOC129914948 [Episyrphus balteatus]|uniref:uncharacterized protein LOC129914948 n=1 Tax=Episyrphus balteatus TaxID=286459 RepID=UPI002486B0E8|nr:uncharacterized protein LOC129914948 [Episyrphus balteatus]
MKFFIVSVCVLLLSNGIYAEIDNNSVDTPNASGFEKCLDADSISCLQMTLFRRAKSIFDNPQIEVFGGVSLIKDNQGRQGKSLDDNSLAVEVAPSVEARTTEMSTYFINSMKNFFAERSLSFNFANTARSIARAIPSDIKDDIKELISEARTGKKKRLLKKFLPIILGIGAKVALLGVASMFGVLLMAKKALVISVLALGVALLAGIGSKVGSAAGAASGLLGGLGGLFSRGGGGLLGSSSNLVPSTSSGWDSNGAYSSPVAQSVAYQGYKQARRR